MPVRNGAQTIRSAARSVLNGISERSELLVFDDGSTDETLDILQRINDRRIHILQDPDLTGVGPALNLLLQEATHAVVARMDADDISLPWRFTAQLAQLRRGDHQIVFGNVIHFGKHKRPHPGYPLSAGPPTVNTALLFANPLPHDTLIGEKRHLLNVGGYRDSPAEDYDLWMRLASNGLSIHRSGLPVLLLRHHEQQTTAAEEWLRRRNTDPFLTESLSALAKSIAPHWGLETRSELLATWKDVKDDVLIREIGRHFPEVPVVHRRYIARRVRAEIARIFE